MRAGVITFPGSNCDEDCSYVLEKLCHFEVERLWHKDSRALEGFDLVVLPGGFSYGDYLRCGAIASLSPIMASVRNFAESGGMVWGICNGFQILCETGLLPGALARNEKLRFVCRDVALEVQSNESPWTCDLKAGEVVRLPIAHGDGRYVLEESEYQPLKDKGQILLGYAGENPNGSAFAIAGVCNERKNVFGLMPHPERAADLRSRDGMRFFQSITRALHEASTRGGARGGT